MNDEVCNCGDCEDCNIHTFHYEEFIECEECSSNLINNVSKEAIQKARENFEKMNDEILIEMGNVMFNNWDSKTIVEYNHRIREKLKSEREI